jgi:hypothetical protein
VPVNLVPLTAFLERRHGVSRSTTSSWASDNSNFLYNNMNPNSPHDATNHMLHPMKLPQIVEDTVVAVRVSLIGAQRLSFISSWL